MKQICSVLILALVTACAALAPPRSQTDVQFDPGHDLDAARVVGSPSPPSAGTGQVGLDGARPVADRGIGGTGAPASVRTAERGIGGTGIVGVITGFGSIFVNGIEVQYDEQASVDVDGNRSSVAGLRAGQLVAIQAEGEATAHHARSISVRTAAAGRIEALELGSGTLTIAGQSVVVPKGTWGADEFGLGDWVRVSGLRRQDGTIVASRLDAAPAGVLLARGQVVRDGGIARVGNLILSEANGSEARDGQFVVVSGDYAAGRGHVSTVASDPLSTSPAAYFGPSASQLIVQAFVQVDKGSLFMDGAKVRSQPDVSDHPRTDGIAVVSLRRDADGAFTAVTLRYGDYRGHTDKPVSEGAGTGTAQAPQRNSHGVIGSSLRSASDNGSANGPEAARAITAEPNPPGASSSMISGASSSMIPGTSASQIPGGSASMIPGASASVTTILPTITAGSVVLPPAPAVASVLPPVDNIVKSQTAPVAAETTHAAAPPTPSSPPIMSVGSPPEITTPPPLVVTPPVTVPIASLPNTGAPVVGQVRNASRPSPDQLASGTGGATPRSSLIWDKPRVPNALLPNGPRPRGDFAVNGPNSAPTISLLTGAVTSVTTMSGQAAPAAASPAGAKSITPFAAVSRGAGMIGTNSGKPVTGTPGRFGGH